MDTILVTKLLAHLAYPSGLIGLCIVFCLLSLVFGKSGRAWLFMLLASCVFLATSNPIVSTNLVSRLENQHPQPKLEDTPEAEAIVVLGGSLRPPAYPRRFSQLSNGSDRFWYAAKLYKAGKAKEIILSGGNIFDQERIKPEAFYIKQILVDLGIPADAIVVEGDSKTTAQNAQHTLDILQQRGIKKILLVTSALHMPRSMKLFQNNNIRVIPCSSDVLVADNAVPDLLNWVPNAKAFQNSTAALHEFYGMWFNQTRDTFKQINSNHLQPLLNKYAAQTQ
ncbi:MAG: YdcF family protein [Arenicella sp.]